MVANTLSFSHARRSAASLRFRQDKAAILAHAADGCISEPDLGHRPQIRCHIQVDIEARIDQAQIDVVAGLDDEPIGALRAAADQ